MLTEKQRLVLEIIKQYIQETGQSPTLDEIQLSIGAKNKHSVVQFLDYLERKRYIER